MTVLPACSYLQSFAAVPATAGPKGPGNGSSRPGGVRDRPRRLPTPEPAWAAAGAAVRRRQPGAVGPSARDRRRRRRPERPPANPLVVRHATRISTSGGRLRLLWTLQWLATAV